MDSHVIARRLLRLAKELGGLERTAGGYYPFIAEDPDDIVKNLEKAMSKWIRQNKRNIEEIAFGEGGDSIQITIFNGNRGLRDEEPFDLRMKVRH